MTNDENSREEEITIYLGLGSNVGDREANLREAKARIVKLGIEITRESSIYETEPVGLTDQPWYLNQVIAVKRPVGPTPKCAPVGEDSETAACLRADALLSDLLNIEHAMGRRRTIAGGPRLIDIDLLLFGDLTVEREREEERSPINPTGIVVPHPRMHLRSFVLEPLCEIAPGLMHPTLKKTCCELLESLEDKSAVRLFTKN